MGSSILSKHTGFHIGLSALVDIYHRRHLTNRIVSRRPIARWNCNGFMSNLSPNLDGEERGRMLIESSRGIIAEAKNGSFPSSFDAEGLTRVKDVGRTSIKYDLGANSIVLARAIRDFANVHNPHQRLEGFAALASEIVKRERLVSFSVMDLSEITHAVGVVALKRLNGPYCSRETHCESLLLADLMSHVLWEFIDRECYITISLDGGSSQDKQWISIEGVSNILFCLKRTREVLEVPGRDSLESRVGIMCTSLMVKHTKKEAIYSCSPLHAVSILRSLMSIRKDVDSAEVSAFKLLLAQIVRKRHLISEWDALEQLITRLELRWVECDSKTRIIPRMVREQLAMQSFR